MYLEMILLGVACWGLGMMFSNRAYRKRVQQQYTKLPPMPKQLLLCVGGSMDGRTLAVNHDAMKVTVPILTGGKAVSADVHPKEMKPPQVGWEVYERVRKSTGELVLMHDAHLEKLTKGHC